MATRPAADTVPLVLACWLFLRQARRLRQLHRTIRLLDGSPQTEPTIKQVVIPCFEESEAAPITAAFFNSRYPETPVTFLVSAAEPQQATTVALRNHPVEVELVAGSNHTKAALVNAFSSHAESPFALYDADSAPVTLPAQPAFPTEVIQQLALYIPPSGAGAFWRGVGLNQSRWALSFEASNSQRRHGWYLVGHGVAIHPALLREHPFHPDIMHGEDLELGYRLSYLGVRLRIDYSGVDHCEVPTGIDELIEQSARWFIGEVGALSQSVRRFGPRPRLLLRFCGLGYWVVGPAWLAALVATSVRRRRWSTLVVLIAASNLELMSFTRLNNWFEARGLPTARNASGLAGYFVKPAIFSLGALRAFIRYRLGYAASSPRKARNGPRSMRQERW